jgi:Fe-S cluster biogenesis protein NfuA
MVGIDPDNIVQVSLVRACQGRPSAVVTQSTQIKATLRGQIPEILFLEAIP